MQSSQPPAPPRATNILTPLTRGRFLVCLLAICAAAFLVAAYFGRRLLLRGYMFPADVLFGFDIDRTIRVIADPHFVSDRSNVHPLFQALASPLGRLARAAHLTMGTAAIAVNAAIGALSLLAAAWYFRRRGVARIDALIATALMASGATWLFQSAFPSTPIFSLLFLILTHHLIFWSLRRGDSPARGIPIARRIPDGLRELAWVALGVIDYGITVTNGAMAVLIYGLGRFGCPIHRSATGEWIGWDRRRWLRPLLYGAAVLAIGLVLSFALRSDLNIVAEKEWVTDEASRGPSLAHPFQSSLASAILYPVVAPVPHVGPTTDARHWQVVTFLDLHYSAIGWALLGAWLLVWCASLIYAAIDLRDHAEQRLNLALAAMIVFHVAMHTFYVISYEGTFLWGGHVYFALFGLLVPLLRRFNAWPAAARRALRIALLALALCIALHNARLLSVIDRFVPLPPGYEAVQ